MSIKLIALDLDDTLLDDKRRITPRVKKAIDDACAAGIKVVLASGRMIPAVMPIYGALGLKAPVICYNGAYVAEPGGEVIFRCPIEAQKARRVVEYARAQGIHIQYFIGDTYYYEHPGREQELYKEISGIAGDRCEDLCALEGGADKLIMIGLPELAQALPRVQAAFPELEIARSKPFYIEINHPEATKGAALAALARRYSLSRDEVMAIGDGTNDLPMLRYAGASVAMDNAPDAVKAECRYVTLSNTRDGVAHAIYTWALEGGKK